MRTVNGFTIIAHRQTSDRGYGKFVILGAQPNIYSVSGYEYIVTTMSDLDNDFWEGNGNYLYTLDAANSAYQTR